MITSCIRPVVQDEVVERLRDMEVPGGSLSEVEGFGLEADPEGGESYGPQVSPYQQVVRLEIACSDEAAPTIAEAIADAARTGRRGDGKVLVTPVTEAIDIRSQETGASVI
ncbi:P-II family nitrogen regulator [Salinibacter altiplanensis]|uniref:P-II family nitrogen regulator n=1 Tax=Salinibacter altiplanensis TaxID=1803181 RepID=UPI001E596793|nr:P-II family nitrogen regulator [Salinibacter altiplanensis]